MLTKYSFKKAQLYSDYVIRVSIVYRNTRV